MTITVQGNRNWRMVGIVTLLAIGFVAAKAFLAPEPAIETLAVADNDDIMRFLSVRDWLSGQAWTDMGQYRAAPPEGVSLHWSRYVDLAIGSIIVAFRPFLGLSAAEAAALILWPLALSALLILATARIGTRVFGSVAAIAAVAAILLWPVTDVTYFRTARMDHHNIQILLSSLVVLSILQPRRPAIAAAASGVFAAVSLAVGLETLPVIGLAGVVLLWRAIVTPETDGAAVAAFSAVLASGATLLHLGQTAPAEWGLNRCDALSPPFLALIWASAAMALTAPLLGRRIAQPWMRAAVIAGLTVALLVPVFPALFPCLAGPYADLPTELQNLIVDRIVEARPAYSFALEGSELFYRYVAPPSAATLIASILFYVRVRRGAADHAEKRAVGTLLVFGWLGVLATMGQIRMVVILANSFPLLAGYSIAVLWDARSRKRNAPGSALALVGCLSLTIFLPGLWFALAPIFAGPADAASQPRHVSDDCRTPDILRTLAALPPSRILAPTNLNAPILLLTDHEVFGVPYHRSARAMALGVLPFESDEAQFRETLASTGADIVVLCRDVPYGDGSAFAASLARGMMAPGLAPVENTHENLQVYEVTR